MPYVVTIHRDGKWLADLSVPNAEDAGKVTNALLVEFPGGLAIAVSPCPQLPDDMPLPIDYPVYGALAAGRAALTRAA